MFLKGNPVSQRNSRLVIEAIQELRTQGKNNPSINQIYAQLYTMRTPMAKEEIVAGINRATLEGQMDAGHLVTTKGYSKRWYQIKGNK